jgi:hypothetical protein
MRCKRSERGGRLIGKLKIKREPCCTTFNSLTVSGARGIGGSGSPIFPQAEDRRQ